MSDVERSIESLRSRVTALEAENERLRHASRDQADTGERDIPRRSLLVTGVGLLGAMAGGEILAQGQTTLAASSTEPTVIGTPFAQPKLQGMRVKLSAKRSSTAVFARYEWSFGKQFTDAKAPIVLASVVDAAMDTVPGDSPVCSVFVYGRPGAYAAVVTVHNIQDSVGEIEVNLLAFGG